MRNYNAQNIIPVGTVMNATIHSLAMSLQTTANFSISIFFVGTPTGSFILEGSNDPYNGMTTPTPRAGSWFPITSTMESVTAAGSTSWDYSECGFNFVRATYTDTSGGTSTATITISSFNGKE